VLPIAGYAAYACNDYALAAAPDAGAYVVLSPRGLVRVRGRDARDRVAWLVERARFAEALDAVEALGAEADADVAQIGQRYVQHLVDRGEWAAAAALCPKVCAGDAKRWEDWVYVFASAHQLQVRQSGPGACAG
jgi:hypothetical protein